MHPGRPSRVRRLQVAKHVIQSTPSILVMPLLCCLVMLLVNVITVVVAAADTHTALIFAREGNVKLAEAFNVLFDTESVAMVEQRESVEAVSWELHNRLVPDGNKVRCVVVERFHRFASRGALTCLLLPLGS